MLRYCANLKAIRCESTSLNRIVVADKSHCAIVTEERVSQILLTLTSRCDSYFESSNISFSENNWSTRTITVVTPAFKKKKKTGKKLTADYESSDGN